MRDHSCFWVSGRWSVIASGPDRRRDQRMSQRDGVLSERPSSWSCYSLCAVGAQPFTLVCARLAEGVRSCRQTRQPIARLAGAAGGVAGHIPGGVVARGKGINSHCLRVHGQHNAKGGKPMNMSFIGCGWQYAEATGNYCAR